MKRFATVFAILTLCVATGTIADDGTVVIGTDQGINTPPPLPDYIEGWNDDQPYSGAYGYGGNCFGFRYVPSVDYTLERIEWYAGGLAGQVTVSVHEDDGSGNPSGPVLGTVTYNEVSTPQWQGADLVPAVPVTGGTLYYISYRVVVGASVSHAVSGTIIPHTWSSNYCASWNGWFESIYWMARFYGQVGGTPTETGSWSMIKSFYR